MQVTFLMLAHEHPERCARIARHLLAAGDSLVLHLDQKAAADFVPRFEAALAPPDTAGLAPGRVYWAERVEVDWGGWSMVQATLNGLDIIEREGLNPDYVYLLSGADYPIRPLEQLHAFLERHAGAEFIEHQDADRARWVRRGLQRARYEYRHLVNWRRYPRLFSLVHRLQRALGLKRRLPEGLKPHLGSQWWVLSWATCRKVMALARRPGVTRFFRQTWVPDELFFQTAVASLLPPEQVQDRLLTHVLFAEYGAPAIFHDDHLDYLSRQPFFFARKISARADRLLEGLDRRVTDPSTPPPDDAAVGWGSYDYEAFVQRHRKGLRGRTSWGRPGETLLGAMERNVRPYFVLVGEQAGPLEDLREELLSREGALRCQGRLFAPDRIGFIEGVPEPMPGSATATALRDQDRRTFLADWLRAADRRMPGFLLTLRDVDSLEDAGGERAGEPPLLQVLARDRFCHIVHLAESAADESLHRQLAGTATGTLDPELLATWTRLTPAEAGDSTTLRDLARALATPTGTALPQTRRPRTLYLHIGAPYTESDQLTAWLREQRMALASRGLALGFDGRDPDEFARLLDTSESDAAVAVARLAREIEQCDAPAVLLSCQRLARLRQIERLLPLTRQFDIRVFCFLRRQDRCFEQWSAREAQGPSSNASDPLTAVHCLNHRRELDWLDWGRLLARWSDVLGEDRVTARRYADSTEERCATLLRWCGIDTTALADFTLREDGAGGVTTPSAPRRRLPPEEARRLLAAYASGNREVARRWFGESREPLFPAPD